MSRRVSRLTLGLDATVIAGTGFGKTLPWAMPLLLWESHDRICLVISPSNEIETDHAQQWFAFEMRPISLLRFCFQGRFFYHEAWDTRSGREQQHTKCSRGFHTKYAFQVLTICARVWATAGF
jgi:hypothetical protein